MRATSFSKAGPGDAGRLRFRDLDFLGARLRGGMRKRKITTEGAEVPQREQRVHEGMGWQLVARCDNLRVWEIKTHEIAKRRSRRRKSRRWCRCGAAGTR